MNHLKSQYEDRRINLDYLKSLQSEEVFDTSQPLYHLANLSKIPRILSVGLVPSMPEATIQAGVLKGENFKGVWLSAYSDPYDIVDFHSLPEKLAYEGRVIKVDGTKLNPNMFNIGIELTFKLTSQIKSGVKITRNQYYSETSEIIYLDIIPPDALTIID